jgi:hypothetical protein
MRRFNVRYSERAVEKLSRLRDRQRSAVKRQKHDDARLLLEAELEHDTDAKGWPYSPFRAFHVIDEHPLRFIYWADHPDVWIVDVEPAPRRWWHGLDPG